MVAGALEEDGRVVLVFTEIPLPRSLVSFFPGEKHDILYTQLHLRLLKADIPAHTTSAGAQVDSRIKIE